MHVFLYEWATGGGLVDEPGSPPGSLLREGTAMVRALAGDLARIDGCHVTIFRDMRVLDLGVPGAEIIDVHSSVAHWEEFERLAAATDGTIVIAPEFDRILYRTAARVLECGGTLFSADPAFIHVTANKHRTAERLARAGVPVPAAKLLDPDEKLPLDFTYPAVLKPIDGAGSQDVQLVTGPHDSPMPYAWQRRLEPYCPGMPASVAVLCGPEARVVLPACQQIISDDGRLRYVGGRLPLAEGLVARSKLLALHVLDALPATQGYVGIDMILGRDPEGGEDFVLEVNPRLTTSYVGLRAAATGNLAAAMLAVGRGEGMSVEFSDRALEFDAQGHVSYI
jgi:predicted ATP-grasp superfamily ATP-dependent carboligase